MNHNFLRKQRMLSECNILSNLEQVVDPQYMVQQIRSLPISSKIEDEQTKWGYTRWLKGTCAASVL